MEPYTVSNTHKNVISVVNPYYPNYSWSSYVKTNAEPTSIYLGTPIGWSLNTINDGASNRYGKKRRITAGRQRGYLKYQNYDAFRFTPFSGSIITPLQSHGRPPNLSLPVSWPPPQIHNGVRVITNDSFVPNGSGIVGIKIIQKGYYKMNIVRTTRDPYQHNQKRFSNKYKHHIYILIFKSGTSYTAISNYLDSIAYAHNLPESSDILKYTPTPGNSCKVLLSGGDIIITFSKKKIHEVTFSGTYLGNGVCTLTNCV
jgi:hypothetical protein